jgi:histidyl-tRNA synthetase
MTILSQKNQKNILTTKGYKGTRDFYPPEQRLKSFLFANIKNTLKSYGYEEYSGPFVEALELYATKGSEEIFKEQLYSFQDQGQRSLAIRPEMTPTLARMIAAKQKELTKPIRWYSIPTCMRFERPQRGRLREFDQLNVDLFGGNPLDEDIEILLTIFDLLKNLGAENSHFEIHVNDRNLTNIFLEKVLRVPQKISLDILRLLDKKDKISDFKEECKKLQLNCEQIKNLERFLSASLEDVEAFLKPFSNTAASDLQQRFHFLTQLLPAQCLKFSPKIMRGFDYYTAMVFEVFDTHPNNRRALFGGGRYDNLVSTFGNDPLSGVGYGVSDVALTNFMEVHGLLPNLKKDTQVCVLRFSETDRLESLKIAQNLRKKSLSVETTVSFSKFGKQIQNAEKCGAQAVVFRGEEDLQKNTFTSKWLASGLQESFLNNEEGFQKFSSKFLK